MENKFEVRVELSKGDPSVGIEGLVQCPGTIPCDIMKYEGDNPV